MSGFTLPGSSEKGVLLIHGLTGDPTEMRPLARLLNREGFTVHVPLLAGHGGDVRSLLATGWRDWLRSVEEAHDAMAATVSQSHVGGICAGALLAVMLAARRPSIAGVAAYSTTFRYDGWCLPAVPRPTLLLLLLGGLPLLRQRGFAEREPFGIKDPRLRELLMKSMAQPNSRQLDAFPFGALRQHVLLARATERAAARVDVPTLIVHARNDDMSSLSNANRLQQRLRGPSSLAVLENSYHMIHLDRENRHVAKLTADYFERPAAGGHGCA